LQISCIFLYHHICKKLSKTDFKRIQMPVLCKIFSCSARSAALASIAFALLLTACGSQDSANTNTNTNTTATTASKTANTSTVTSPSGQTDSGLLKSLAALYPNGQLPTNRAAQTANERLQNPAALKLTTETAATAKSQNGTFAAKSTLTTQTVAADYKPVNRLQMPPATLYGAYFFTIYDAERDAALASNADWKQEGAAFWTSLATGEGLNPVHRYRNLFNGSYIYTIYDSERADIAANYASSFAYEGVAWYARQTQSEGWSPLYRFRNLTNNTYLFTAYEAEKDAIVAGYSAVFTLEGIAYYVRQDAPDGTAPVITILGDNPQSLSTGTAYTEAGATCVDNKDPSCTVVTTGTVNTATAGTYTITYTATDAAGNASSKTRAVTVAACTAATNASTGYSLVFKGCSAANVAEYYDKTECVRDNASGLIWQGQTPAGTGLRANDQQKTNFDSTTGNQNGSIPATQLQIDALSNSIGYKTAVNAALLCGSAAWRLPTKIELLGLVKATETPMIDNGWFPNTLVNYSYYWTSTAGVSDSKAGVVDFTVGGVGSADGLRSYNNSNGGFVRLVR
jgi:Domain of unknown function (DUF5011)/Protein of unknown function (DUF1566)/Repeat of unknown function (DUF5648)